MVYRLGLSKRTKAVIGTLLLLGASLVPSSFERHPSWDPVGPDKFLHLIGYGAYTVTLAEAFSADEYSDGEAAVLAVCVSFTLSIITGRLQRYVPGREFELADVVAGAVGIAFAAVGWCVANKESAKGSQR